MRGQILGVDLRTGEGQVAGDDGSRYTFRQTDWAHRVGPAIGLYVDFEPDQTRALSIFPVPAAPATPTTSTIPGGSDRNRYVAALLAFFLGYLGVHRFYLGRTGSGVAMLVLSCTVIGLLITIPWSVIDAIRYLMKSDREFARDYARDSA